MSTRADIHGSKVTAFPARQDANSQSSDKGSDKPFVPVSERVEGESVLGRISAMVEKGCPGPAGRWPCALPFGHPSGDHVRADSFEGYLLGSLKEVQEGVSKLKAERDELLAALRKTTAAASELHAQGIGCPDCPPEEDGFETDGDCPMLLAAEALIAKAEEGR